MKKAFVLGVLLCLHTPALAAEYYTKPAPPASLLEAIARQGSGLNLLAVNIAGKSYYPSTREEAERLIRQAITAGQSFNDYFPSLNSYSETVFFCVTQNGFNYFDTDIFIRQQAADNIQYTLA